MHYKRDGKEKYVFNFRFLSIYLRYKNAQYQQLTLKQYQKHVNLTIHFNHMDIIFLLLEQNCPHQLNITLMIFKIFGGEHVLMF